MIETQTANNPDNEQRDYFRVQTEGFIEVIPCHKGDDLNHLANLFRPSPLLMLMEQCQKMDCEAQKLLSELYDLNSNISQCFKLMQKKHNLLLEYLGSEQFTHETPSPISISESGLSSFTNQTLNIHQSIAIRIVFSSGYKSIQALGKVTRCERNSTEGYHLAAEFLNMHPSDKYILSRHIMQVQRNRAQHAKLAREDSQSPSLN